MMEGEREIIFDLLKQEDLTPLDIERNVIERMHTLSTKRTEPLFSVDNAEVADIIVAIVKNTFTCLEVVRVASEKKIEVHATLAKAHFAPSKSSVWYFSKDLDEKAVKSGFFAALGRTPETLRQEVLDIMTKPKDPVFGRFLGRMEEKEFMILRNMVQRVCSAFTLRLDSKPMHGGLPVVTVCIQTDGLNTRFR